MRTRFVAVTAAAVAAALVAAAPAAGARAVVSSRSVITGARVIVLGTGFAPPNEFCRPVTLRVDGAATPATRFVDDAGGWALRFTARQAVGRHRLALRQVCESGKDGSLRTTVARTALRITKL